MMAGNLGLLNKQGAREVAISVYVVGGADAADNEELMNDITRAYLKYRSRVDIYIRRVRDMEKYNLAQKFSITDENGFVKKECEVKIYINQEGINRKQIMDMLHTIACQYEGLLEEDDSWEGFGIDLDATKGQTRNIKKGWFSHE